MFPILTEGYPEAAWRAAPTPPVSSGSMAVSVGELVAANVADKRVWDTYGESSAPGVYLLGSPGRALPFAVYRAWKVPIGTVSEEIRFIGPSGRTIHRWGPAVRRMAGMMELTTEVDTIDDAVFDETGTFVASFIIEDVIVGETEVAVYVQEAPSKLPKEIEDGFKRSDVLWVGVEGPDGKRRTVPAWFAYKNGRLYFISQKQSGPQEQTIPGIPGADEVVIISRRKGRDTALDEFYGTVRLLEGAEWDEAAKLLVDRRRSRNGPPAEAIQRWKTTCHIVEVTPLISA
jgi:hypothetical protein